MAQISHKFRNRPVILGNFAWLGATTADQHAAARTMRTRRRPVGTQAAGLMVAGIPVYNKSSNDSSLVNEKLSKVLEGKEECASNLWQTARQCDMDHQFLVCADHSSVFVQNKEHSTGQNQF